MRRTFSENFAAHRNGGAWLKRLAAASSPPLVAEKWTGLMKRYGPAEIQTSIREIVVKFREKRFQSHSVFDGITLGHKLINQVQNGDETAKICH